jgi:hypothetical protein
MLGGLTQELERAQAGFEAMDADLAIPQAAKRQIEKLPAVRPRVENAEGSVFPARVNAAARDPVEDHALPGILCVGGGTNTLHKLPGDDSIFQQTLAGRIGGEPGKPSE